MVRTTNSGMTSPQISTAAADYLHDFSGLVDFSAPPWTYDAFRCEGATIQAARKLTAILHGCRDLQRVIAAGDLFLVGSGGWWCGLGAGLRAGAVGGKVR